MTHYRVQVDLTCPSNWSDPDVRRYIERIAPTREERDSIRITSLDPGIFDHPVAPPAPDLVKAAKGAWCLCQSLLAVREGATDDLIREIACALEAALEPVPDPPSAIGLLQKTQCCDPVIDAHIGALLEENKRLKSELAELIPAAEEAAHVLVIASRDKEAAGLRNILTAYRKAREPQKS